MTVFAYIIRGAFSISAKRKIKELGILKSIGPSLEACGFDIARTTSELFGIELKWGTDGSLPEYLTLVCGFFHNAENIIWNG